MSGFWYISWVLSSSIGINSPLLFHSFHNEHFIQPVPATLMSRRSSKGKRKASPSPAHLSSDESDTAPDERHLTKKARVSSPGRVRKAIMGKVDSGSKPGSSSKGLAGLAALIKSSSLSASRKETVQGLRSGSSSKQSRSAGSSKAGRAVCVLSLFIC